MAEKNGGVVDGGKVSYTEQVSYVSIDLCDCEDDFEVAGLEYEILGIDTQNPLIRIGNKVFRGEYQYLTTTSLFFQGDSERDNRGELTGTADRIMIASSVALVPKEPAQDTDNEPKENLPNTSEPSDQ